MKVLHEAYLSHKNVSTSIMPDAHNAYITQSYFYKHTTNRYGSS